MKKITFLIFLLMASMGFSQISPIDFEAGGNGASWTFIVFVNGDDPPIEIVANPDPTGANTSAMVAKFTVRQAGADFAGAFTDDIGTFNLTATNSTVKVKVWKPVISDFAIKFEGPNGNIGELKVANTVINQWEELTFDFSPFIGMPAAIGINRLVIFPDFAVRSQDNIVYFDSITFSAILGVAEHQSLNFKVYPNPASENWVIKSEKVMITSMQLLDVQGKQIMYQEAGAFEMKVDTSYLTPGIYMARINSANGTETIKLVKQ